MAIKNVNLDTVDDVIFISDIHLGLRPNTTEWPDNMTDYFDNFFFPLVRKEFSEGYNPVVVIAGDFFDNRQVIDIDCMNRGMDIMEKMSSLCPVYIMIGNHDIYKKKDTDVTSVRIFEKYKNVTIIPDKMILNIKGNHSFMLVSWIGDFSKESKLIAKYKDKYEYIVLHTEISGMTYDNGRPIVNGINLSAIDENCHIISGHIHKRQSNEKAMYLGSPYMTKRMDIGNEKGIYCFRNGNDNKICVNFTQNDYSPKFIRVNFSEYGKKVEVWANVVRNNYVDIIFEEEELNRFNVNKFADDLQEYEPKKIEFFTNKKAKTEETSKYNEDATIEDIFVDQINNKGLTDIQHQTILELNTNYIKRAGEEIGK